MAQVIDKFNSGGTTSSSISEQFNEKFVTQAVAEMAPRKRFFSQRSNPIAMPKNFGDAIWKEVRLPILHKDNMVDGNVDATTAKVVQNMYFAYNAAGALVGTYDVEALAITGSITMDTARTNAYNAAVTAAGAGGKVKSNAGYILGGKASYAVGATAIPVLPEEGGVIGLLNSSSKMVKAKMTFHAIGLKYTVRSADLDSRKGLIAQKIKDLSQATHELKEIQVMNSIIAASEMNRIIGSTTATSIGEMQSEDVLSYEFLSAFEQELLGNDVPMETEIIEGTTKIDTKVVEDGWVVYCNRELMPSIRKVKGPDGSTLAFIPKSQYAAGTTLLDGEFGAIGSFRFVINPDLQAYRGMGSVVADDTATDKANRHATGGKFDVFPMIVVGSDSFSTTGFTDRDVTARHIEPKADVYNDMHAQVGGVASSWSYGFLNYRPERIRQLAVVATKV
jgi:N4-gp56 family major capsid protein